MKSAPHILLICSVFRGYNILFFLYFSNLVQEENLKDPKPFQHLKIIGFLGFPGAPPERCPAPAGGAPRLFKAMTEGVVTVNLLYDPKVLIFQFCPPPLQNVGPAWALVA